jgi:D-sedoheptulose 7-phosphate isomerase
MSTAAPSRTVLPHKTEPAPITSATEYFRVLSDVVQRMPPADVEEVAAVLLQAYEQGRTVFLFGNGGSASLASHFACDLGKGTAPRDGRRKRFRVVSLTDNIPTMTAYANDASYDDIFAEPLLNQVGPGDVVFAISCSGNSTNVLKALKVARTEGAFIIGLTGFQGGEMKALCDLCIVAPSTNMQIIEDLHLSIAHCIFSIAHHQIQNGLTLSVVPSQSND